jgi:hypothetical protein
MSDGVWLAMFNCCTCICQKIIYVKNAPPLKQIGQRYLRKMEPEICQPIMSKNRFIMFCDFVFSDLLTLYGTTSLVDFHVSWVCLLMEAGGGAG